MNIMSSQIEHSSRATIAKTPRNCQNKQKPIFCNDIRSSKYRVSGGSNPVSIGWKVARQYTLPPISMYMVVLIHLSNTITSFTKGESIRTLVPVTVGAGRNRSGLSIGIRWNTQSAEVTFGFLIVPSATLDLAIVLGMVHKDLPIGDTSPQAQGIRRFSARLPCLALKVHPSRGIWC